ADAENSSPVRGAERLHLGRALCIITGASRGFGRTISTIDILISTRETQLCLYASSSRTLESCSACVPYVATDLGLAEGLEQVTKAAQEAASDLIQHVLLVNNAGSLGDTSRFAMSFTEMAEVNSYLSLNVSSFLCLTAQIPSPGQRRTIINISSLCALKPFSSWVLYCSGKAAREMMFRVLAEEEPDLRVLNYSPVGKTAAHVHQAASVFGDALLRKSFNEMFTQGQLLSCEESCNKLMKLLMEDSYTSGAHVDFYDI
uniref:Sepiapterin reductase n=1 Tax=Neogobius melanostomus TaxID=47308 RepID=A0A8C6WMJ9_9GOBI